MDIEKNENSFTVKIGREFKLKIGRGRVTSKHQIILSFNAEDALNETVSDSVSVLAPKLMVPFSSSIRRVPYSSPISLPHGWILFAIPSGILGECSWLLTRCSQRVIFLSPRILLSKPLPPCDYLVTLASSSLPLLSEILKKLIHNKANGEITLLVGTWKPAAIAAAALPDSMVLIVAKSANCFSDNFYEFQTDDAKLKILNGEKKSGRVIASESFDGLGKIENLSAVFVHDDTADAIDWLNLHYPGINFAQSVCEPDVVSIEAIQNLSGSSRVIRSDFSIPPTVTRTLSTSREIPGNSRVSIRCDPEGRPHLVSE
jgi:hypothetical protein